MQSYELAVKIIGAAFVFISAGIWSVKYRQMGKERLRRLRGQIDFVGFVRERIERYLLPISQIISECDKKTADALVIGCQESEYADIDGLRAILRGGRYYSDGGEVFERFLSSLGSSYREEEVLGCDACHRDLSALYGKLSAEIPKDAKSRTVLAFCLSAAIVIILF